MQYLEEYEQSNIDHWRPTMYQERIYFNYEVWSQSKNTSINQLANTSGYLGNQKECE